MVLIHSSDQQYIVMIIIDFVLLENEDLCAIVSNQAVSFCKVQLILGNCPVTSSSYRSAVNTEKQLIYS